MTRVKITFTLVLASFLSFGCKKTFFEPQEDTPTAIFNELWNKCNENYSFFEYKGIDWDSIRNFYEQFITDDINDLELFFICSEMLKELKDGHVNLISPYDVMKYSFDLNGPENYNDRIIRENYLGEFFYETGPFRHDFISNNEIGYINYRSFSGIVSDFSMDFMLARYQNTKGIIIDIRSNGGGSISNVFKIINRFSSQKQLLYHSFLKSGPGREDFGDAQAAYTTPEGEYRFDKEFVVLTDRGSFSASSFFTLAARELPNCTIIGDTTGGGLGIPNGGQLANGWTYRFSVSRTLTPAGENFENGVPPDILQNLDSTDKNSGIDSIIERAIFEILN